MGCLTRKSKWMRSSTDFIHKKRLHCLLSLRTSNTSVSVGKKMQKTISNPGGSWGALMTSSWQKWKRTEWGEGAVLDLVLSNKEDFHWDDKAKDSDHEMVELRILRAGNRAKSKLTTLDYRRADFDLFIHLLWRASWDNALEGKETQECWLTFKDHLPEWGVHPNE